jgi:hypothetical protein
MVRASVKTKKDQGSKRKPIERISLVDDDEDDEAAGLLGENAPTMHAFETTMLQYERGEIKHSKRRKSPVREGLAAGYTIP